MDSITTLDAAAITIIVLGMARGAYIGMIRESLSIASLAVACIAVRFGRIPVAEWITSVTHGEIGDAIAPWIAGTFLVVFTITVIGLLGRALKRGVQVVGLGWADRLGGTALGTAEGGLIAALLVTLVMFILSAEHPVIRKSQSVEAVEVLQQYVSRNVGEFKLPDVAAEPR